MLSRLLPNAVRIARPTRALRSSLPLSCHFIRRYISPAVNSIPLERQREIVAAIRAYQKDGVTVPWFDLAHRFRLSQSDMEQMVALDDYRRQKRRELSARVTQLADRAFDPQRGRCDWASVVKKLDMPLMECLGRFDASLSSVPVRSLPKFVDWLPNDFLLLKEFVQQFPGTLTTDDQQLVSAFMNVKQADCAMAYNMCIRPRMTTELFKLITSYREKGMLWKDIHQQIPVFASLHTLRCAYSQFKAKVSSGPKLATSRVRWTDAETARVCEIIRQHHSYRDMCSCLRVAECEFPDKSQQSVRSKLKNTLRERQGITVAEMRQLKALVDEYGQDWVQIGQTMDVTPEKARQIWDQYQQHSKLTKGWTSRELDILRECIRDGIGSAEASRRIGTKSQSVCYLKMRQVKLAGKFNDSTEEKTANKLLWTSGDEARLLHLVTLYDPRAIDWATIAGDLGRAVNACKLRYRQLRKQRKPKLAAEHADAVSHAVKKQYTQHQSVDWARVSESVGLSERECLEANQFGDGKARWIYDPDTFSWDMANRMTTFIEVNYPRPLPVNYTAVSNYMWIERDDCIKMAGLLRGEMTWTEDAVAKVVELRNQGTKYKDIARQLSPNLTARKTRGAVAILEATVSDPGRFA
ncbi:hypothetical protein IWW55_000298 [Coemansia sp. RSA 2706]|nr:hypothetical protein IWW55_000298 [Coemansia sp. RSA 2706]